MAELLLNIQICSMGSSYVTKNYSALVDFSTGALLVMGNSSPALIFLSECMPDTHFVPFVNDPNYTGSFFELPFLALMKPENYPKWAWDKVNRIFVKTEKGVLNEQLRAKSRLAVSKHAVINRIINNISVARNKTATGVRLQDERVYPAKKMQAQAFKDSGYSEDLIAEYPYVVQYADFAKLSLKQAAEEILFKARMNHQMLINTESLRLRYFKKVREAKTPEELPIILKKFLSDCFFVV
jgi:hypothetical protein